MLRKVNLQVTVGLILAFLLILVVRFASGQVSHRFGAAEMYVLRLWTLPLFNLGRLPVTPLSLLKTSVFVVALNFACARLRGFLYTRLLSHTGFQPQDRYMLARFCSFSIFVIGLMVGFESMGLNLNTLTIFGGTLGVGLGFGLQSIAANWVAGIVLLMERSVRIGDRVDVKDTCGVVTKIGGRSTWIRTYNNHVMIVPNSEFINHQIVNWTLNDSRVRLAIPVEVARNSKADEVQQCLVSLAARHSSVLPNPPPDVILTGLGTSSLDFVLRVWVLVGAEDNDRLKSELYLAMLEAFGKLGIEGSLTPASGASHE